MHSSILLCDREWKIDRILYSIPEQIFSEGAYLTDFLSDSDILSDSSEFEDESHSLLSFQILDEPFERNVLINTFPKYFLVSLVHLEKAEDFNSFLQTLIPLLSWAEEELQTPYQDDYYRIELMNNQLINNQRALMKSNQRLSQTLKEVREANSVIALLEQDELTTLYCASAFYQKAQQLIKKNKDTSYDILALDLKRFKLVNETFGRESGDKLLKALAFFLRGLEGAESGLFARASADTFYILMPHDLQFHETLHRELPLFFQTYPLPMQLHWKIGVYAMELQKEQIPIEQM